MYFSSFNSEVGTRLLLLKSESDTQELASLMCYLELDTNLKTTLRTLSHTCFLFLYAPPSAFFRIWDMQTTYSQKELQVDVHLTYCMVFTKNIQFGCQCHSYLVFGYVVHLNFNLEHFQNSLGFLKWIMY